MITLGIIAKHSPNSFQALVDMGLYYTDEVVVIVDVDAEPGIMGYRASEVTYYTRALEGDFAAQRNFLVEHCTQSWVLHLDTDENLQPWLWQQLPLVLTDMQADLVMLPRANRYVGAFDVLVNWPDWQPKLHRRHVRWRLPVHEWPVGFSSVEFLPEEERYAIQHLKTHEQQRKADELYAQIRVDAD